MWLAESGIRGYQREVDDIQEAFFCLVVGVVAGVDVIFDSVTNVLGAPTGINKQPMAKRKGHRDVGRGSLELFHSSQLISRRTGLRVLLEYLHGFLYDLYVVDWTHGDRRGGMGL